MAVAAWSAAGLVVAIRLIRSCVIREFGSSPTGPRLLPLFESESVWGPTEVAEPRMPSKWEVALGGGQSSPTAMSTDLVRFETRDEPLSPAEARQEVLRGEFLQPLPDERLGWLEKVLRLSFFGREHVIANCLLLDGRYWTPRSRSGGFVRGSPPSGSVPVPCCSSNVFRSRPLG